MVYYLLAFPPFTCYGEGVFRLCFSLLLCLPAISAPDPHLTNLCGHVARGDFAGAETCLRAGANPDAADSRGKTPLIIAAGRGDTRLAHLLLQAGAHINAHDAYGRTPLHEAARYGQTACIRLLLQHGADIHSKDAHGRTALMLATQHGHHASALLLARPRPKR